MNKIQSPPVRAIVDGILKYLEKTDSILLLPQIIEQLEQKLADKTQSAIVETTIELDEAEKAQIEKLIGKCTYKTSPDLIGGMRITRGDKVLDLSIKAKLDKIYEQI